MPRRKHEDETLGAVEGEVVQSSNSAVQSEPVVDGLVEVHMCGKGRELLEVVRLDPSRRRHSIAWQGHHYEHYDIIANDVWRYAQVD